MFPHQWYRMNRIELMLETTATRIDTSAKTVEVVGRDGREKTLEYDSLVLCTGAEAVETSVPGKDLPQVYKMRILEDGGKLLEATQRYKSAVVVGAGFVRLETAAALKRRGLEVAVVELLPQILDGVLDPELASEVQKRMEEMGIRFFLNSGLREIRGKDRVEGVLAGEQELPCEMVVVAAGVRANIQLARDAGIEVIEKPPAVKVDDRMETSARGVYAAGDCVICPSHAIAGQPWLSQLGTVAVRQGKVAGTNAAGGDARFPPVLGTCVSKIFDIEIASTGLTESYAKKLGIDCVSATIEAPARPHYVPEEVPTRVKVVAKKLDGRVIGVQIVAPKEAGLRAEIASIAIAKGATIDELSIFDNCYCPVVADVNEPLSVAAELLMRKMKR